MDLKKKVTKLEDFDYELPKELVAQKPQDQREMSRLLAIDRQTGVLEDRHFFDIDAYFQRGDVLVLNDSKVFPAKLIGKKETGGKVDVLLLEPTTHSSRTWSVLIQPKIREGQNIIFLSRDAKSRFKGICKGRDREGIVFMDFPDGDVRGWAEVNGKMPLPPYIKRLVMPEDRIRYQTVYAREEGSVASPTAGLHFTRDLLDKIESKGVVLSYVTLHVGPGTFRPVMNLEEHQMHAEAFELKSEVVEIINRAKRQGCRIWAVGSTSLRVLETCVIQGELKPGRGLTNLFITPGAEFECVNGLITNFHLPRTTLLMLVSAFMGHRLMHLAYDHAVQNKYRFYSYGDAMIIR